MGSEAVPDVRDGENGIGNGGKGVKLHGRAFYESIGSPKMVLAPMVEQSEFAWRLLTRSFLPSSQSDLLSYTPMFHSRMFHETPKYRDSHFQPLKSAIPSPPDAYHISQLPESESHLDGNPKYDRPLTVQFCSNDPDDLLNAAKLVAPFCDAVDLNLGCPQGIARRGNYGAFLQEDWDLISRMVSKLHAELSIPITAKMRILSTREKTLEYAKTLLDAGASIITVHGRQREQKGHNTGLADWSVIRYLRENLPKETVIFANGNILQHEDIWKCLKETGADAVMSAEGNLHDPTIFAKPPAVGDEGREYWRGRDGKGGFRVDAVMRRYLDIIHKYALGVEPPARRPLFLPSDSAEEPALAPTSTTPREEGEDHHDGPPRKKIKHTKAERKQQKITNPNLTAMQAHLFHLLRPLVAQHHNVRDALAKCRVGNIEAFEHVLALVEGAVKEGLITYEKEVEQEDLGNSAPASTTIINNGPPNQHANENGIALSNKDKVLKEGKDEQDPHTSSLAAVARCKRPFWICQPYVRPVPKEAIEKGSMQLSKKDRKKMEQARAEAGVDTKTVGDDGVAGAGGKDSVLENGEGKAGDADAAIPKQGVGVVCG